MTGNDIPTGAPVPGGPAVADEDVRLLSDFVAANREQVIERSRRSVANRAAPRPTEEEISRGIPLFVDQLILALRARGGAAGAADSAAAHGADMLKRGFTIAQVVYDYGDVCQAITQLAVEQDTQISAEDFQMLNGCLDDAIAEAVTEYSRQRDRTVKAGETERLGYLAHELRNKLNAGMLAFGILKEGKVGVSGNTGAVLERSLAGLQDLITRSLAAVRIESGIQHRERVNVREMIEDVEAEASLAANARRIRFSVNPVPEELEVDADRPLLVAALMNLLSNALKFTPVAGHTWLRTTAQGDHVLFEVEDECGGLPGDDPEALFAPWAQRSSDKRGLGLGLALVRRSVQALGGEVKVTNKPGKGCVFGIRLLRSVPLQSPIR